MTWLRTDDNFDRDPMILNVCRTRRDKTLVLGYLYELMLHCASGRTDGFLPDMLFRDAVRSKRWRELLTSPPTGTALIHRRGDTCACLKDRVWRDDAADLYVHHYLLMNPTAAETDVARLKSAELRDAELRAVVRRRDRDRCRYCAIVVRWADRRSAVGGVLDHVDPTRADGAANLVVSCRGCNSRKGGRTPAGAGMTLLPAPGSDLAPTNGSATDPDTDVPVRDGTGRATDPPPRPPSSPRTSLHPDPHTRSVMARGDPMDHAGLPTPEDIDDAQNDLWLDHADEFT